MRTAIYIIIPNIPSTGIDLIEFIAKVPLAEMPIDENMNTAAIIIKITGTIIFIKVFPINPHALPNLLNPSLKKSKALTSSPLFNLINEIIRPKLIGTFIIKTIIFRIALIELFSSVFPTIELTITENNALTSTISAPFPHLPVKASLAFFLVSVAVIIKIPLSHIKILYYNHFISKR